MPAPVKDDGDLTKFLAGLRVLIAEDHEIIRRVSSASLSRYGALPTEASDGVEAVSLAARQRFDLILMDINMPQLGGVEATARIRRDGGPSATTRIIGITAHLGAEDLALAEKVGMDTCLTKPLNLMQLAAVLQPRAETEKSASGETWLDISTLDEVRSLLDATLFLQSLETLDQQIGEAGREIGQFLDNGNSIAARSAAHKLAGGCLMLGAVRLASHLSDFELLVGTANQEALHFALAAMMPIMEATRDAIQNQISAARHP